TTETYQKEEQNQAYIFINVKKSKIMSLLPIGAHTHSRYAAFCPLSFSWLNSIVPKCPNVIRRSSDIQKQDYEDL
ncbi:MAG TPA: hypothetical protein PKH33_07010, partial [bacterium]|nr:hypothetical protein [bacterium]